MTPIIRADHLRHVYSAGTPFEKVAIDDIDLAIPAGQFVGIIGHTGSGKSTFIQHLNGLLAPTSGTVLFDGEDIHRSKAATRDVRFQVGLVFQYPEHQLFEETVYQDIAFGPKNAKLSTEEVDARVCEAAPHMLSGGQKQRIAIAGILAMQPSVIIADESTAMLDPSGRREVLSTIRRLNREKGITVVWITHFMEEAAQADRIIVMNQGEAALSGTPREVFPQVDTLRELHLDVPHMTALADSLRRDGMPLPGNILTVDEMTKEVLTLLCPSK